jgi:organic hydroperoxide reductase OsmC/OhrA
MQMYLFKNTVYQKLKEPAKMLFGGTNELEIGPAPEFGGKAGVFSAEEMFIGTVNSCLMMTLFYFLRKADIEILSYHSDAEGQVEKRKDGFRFTNVEVKAKVKVNAPDQAEKIEEMGKLAEKYCLVSRSVACPVNYRLQVETEGK